MPERGAQFPEGEDFLAKHGFSETEQGIAGLKAKAEIMHENMVFNALMHYGSKLMKESTPEGRAKAEDTSRSELAVHGYHPKQVEHVLGEEGKVFPAAVHHHGDFSAHWEPGHDSMFVYHKSQDRLLDADPVASIPVRHLHAEEGAHVPTVNQEALARWHSDPENVEKAMGQLS